MLQLMISFWRLTRSARLWRLRMVSTERLTSRKTSRITQWRVPMSIEQGCARIWSTEVTWPSSA